METIYTFARVERKYFIDELTRKRLLQRTRGMLLPDAYGKSTVCSLYLDTPDHLIIRNSLDARSYKEKLRLRSYGTPKADTPVFLELKKKVQGVVYKRRVSLPLREAEAYLDRKRPPLTGQIWREIDYAMQFYFWPGPAMVIACEREAYTWAEDPTFRVTFDDSIRARSNALCLEAGSSGEMLLPQGLSLMELKSSGAMPVAFAKIINELGLLPTSFSKYGTGYINALTAKTTVKEPVLLKGAMKHVSNL